eukprot:TRINITY_DN23221_c0_g1_i1.p1 TRINITY_DN23221_c0_g1~~TRINITY_DN23221_c0_g1_i1.p1  ORF type:complete len:139 (+),score=6.37 TRINITY_DN23221_c0_g1_i1:47-463(+)
MASPALDPGVDCVFASSSFVVIYFLQRRRDSKLAWRSGMIEGPLYVIQRSDSHQLQLVVNNAVSSNGLEDTINPSWVIDYRHLGYLFYDTGIASERIRAVWFHDDADRDGVTSALRRHKSGTQDHRSERSAVPAGQSL